MTKIVKGDIWDEVPGSDLTYQFFRYFCFTYVWDLNTETLFRVGLNSFKLIKSTLIYNRVANAGTKISEEGALLLSDFNYVPLNIWKWVKPIKKGDDYSTLEEDITYQRYDGDKYFFDRKSYTLYKIFSDSFQMEKCPIRASMIHFDGSVISREQALDRTIFDTLPLPIISDFLKEDDPYYLKRHTPDKGESLTYLKYGNSYYASHEDNNNMLRIETDSLCYITDQKLITAVKGQGKTVSMKKAFGKSNISEIPDYLMRTLFKEKDLCACMSNHRDILEWPADCFPHVKSRFAETGRKEITFYYSVEEDEYETSFGDGLYYHYDRPFLTEKDLNRYVELRKSQYLINYEPRELVIKLADNQLVFSNPSGTMEEYYPEEVLKGLDDICSDPDYSSHVQELLKVFCILDRRNRCESLIKSFKPALYAIGKKTTKIDPESPLYYPLLKPCHHYNSCEPFILENTKYPHDAFDHCTTCLDLDQFHFVEKLRNVISVFDTVFRYVLEINTDEYSDPALDLCVDKLRGIKEELKDHLIDMGRMMEGKFDPYLKS